MRRPKIFIGSSGASLRIARAVAKGLEKRACGVVTVWDEGVFGINDEILGRLLKKMQEFDFAVLVWAGDDTLHSKGKFLSSPRDNVVFECGLFMGALGRDRVFVVIDDNESTEVKRPSDFAGVVLASYDGARAEPEVDSAVRAACDSLEERIKEQRVPELAGMWRSRYFNGDGGGIVMDDVEVSPSPGGVMIESKPSNGGRRYMAYGRILGHESIVGDWHHAVGETFAEGSFMLVISPLANIMYGYYSGRDENGAVVFQPWVFAKQSGQSEEKLKQQLDWGESQVPFVRPSNT